MPSLRSLFFCCKLQFLQGQDTGNYSATPRNTNDYHPKVWLMAILAGIIEGGVQYTGQTLRLDQVFSEFVENILKIPMFKTLAPGLIAFNTSKLFFSSTSESKYKSSSPTETLSFYSYHYIIPVIPYLWSVSSSFSIIRGPKISWSFKGLTPFFFLFL